MLGAAPALTRLGLRPGNAEMDIDKARGKPCVEDEVSQELCGCCTCKTKCALRAVLPDVVELPSLQRLAWPYNKASIGGRWLVKEVGRVDDTGRLQEACCWGSDVGWRAEEGGTVFRPV